MKRAPEGPICIALDWTACIDYTDQMKKTQINIRVSEQELVKLKEAAEAAGMAMSAYILNCALKGAVGPEEPRKAGEVGWGQLEGKGAIRGPERVCRQCGKASGQMHKTSCPRFVLGRRI